MFELDKDMVLVYISRVVRVRVISSVLVSISFEVEVVVG